MSYSEHYENLEYMLEKATENDMEIQKAATTYFQMLNLLSQNHPKSDYRPDKPREGQLSKAAEMLDGEEDLYKVAKMSLWGEICIRNHDPERVSQEDEDLLENLS